MFKKSIFLFLALGLVSSSALAERTYEASFAKKTIEMDQKALAEQNRITSPEYKTKERDERMKFYQQKYAELHQTRAQAKLILEQLKKTPIYGIEILTAGSDATEMASAFGHSAIRLILGKDPLQDIVIGPQAFIDDQELDMGKGFTGGYTIIPQMMSFMDFMIQYHRGEFRSLTRTIVPTTPSIRLKLIDAVLELNSSPVKYGKSGYKFMTNNCATVVMKLLEKAGIVPEALVTTDQMNNISFAAIIPSPASAYLGLFGLASDLPTVIPNQLRSVGSRASSIPDAYIPAIDVFFKEMKEHGSYFLSKKVEKWKQKDIDNLSKLSTRALYMLYVGPLKLTKNIEKLLINLLKDRDYELNDIYNMDPYNFSLYQTCATSKCAKVNFGIIKKSWDRAALFLTANSWGVAPYVRIDTSKETKFKSSDEYYLYMQNLYSKELM